METLVSKISDKITLNSFFDISANIFISFVYIVISSLLIKILNKIIKKSLSLNTKLTIRKKNTIETVLTSTIKYGLWFIVLCSILSSFGININSLIAVAGVGSVAIGFGAQSLVKDIITGMFILFEDQFGIGDIITIDTLTGKVESIGLRTTAVRSLNGDLYIIPNGSIKTVTNMSKDFNRALIDISVSYDDDIDKILSILRDEMTNIYSNKLDGLTKMPNVLGIEAFCDSSITIRILADTQIDKNWEVEREMRRLIKVRFDKEDIQMPYPVMVIEIKK